MHRLDLHAPVPLALNEFAVKMGIRFGLIERVRFLLQWLLITRRSSRAHVKAKIDEDLGRVEQEAAGG